jgi:DNA invertase Pin-like site-specific DNA recombinase
MSLHRNLCPTRFVLLHVGRQSQKVGHAVGTKGQRIGYVRTSTAGQRSDRQHEAIGAVDRVFEDKVSGKDTNRPALREMLLYCRDGDTLVVGSLDRLARNLADLLDLVSTLTSQGVRVEFVKEGLTFTGDQDDPMSNLLLGVLGSIAAFERSLIRERQREGIALAKERGAFKGRKPALSPALLAEARERDQAGEKRAQIARDLGVGRSTLYRALGQEGYYAPRAA